MNKKNIIAVSVLAAVFSQGASAEISSTVTFTSEYLWRGVTQTQGDPAVQASIDYSHDSGFYLGVWGSNVDFGGSADLEVDLYAGYSAQLTDEISYDVGYIRYMFPDSDAINFDEIYGSVSFKGFTLGVNYSNDFAGTDADEFYYSAAYAYDLSEDLSLHASVGYTDLDLPDSNATDYLVGVGYEYQSLSLDLSYFDLDHDVSSNDDDGVVFTVSRTF